MQAIRIHRRLDSQTLDLPELASWMGQEVEIIVLPAEAVTAAPRHPRVPGVDQGKIVMSDDFDAPLDDFAEYM